MEELKEYHVTDREGFGGLMLAFGHEFGDNVITLNDNLSFGPIKNLDTFLGKVKRYFFLRKVDKSIWKNDVKNLRKIKRFLKKGNKLVFWVGPNSKEELQVLHLIPLLEKYYSQISIVSFKKQNWGEEKYIYSLRECSPNQIKKMKDKKTVTKADVIKFTKFWQEIIDESKGIRIRKEKFKYSHEKIDFYDKNIFEACTNTFEKYKDVAGNFWGFLSGDKDVMSDEFLQYRIRYLIRKKKLDYQFEDIPISIKKRKNLNLGNNRSISLKLK